MKIDQNMLKKAVLHALTEDMPYGDITTDSLIDEHSVSKALLTVKQDGVIAGLCVAECAFVTVDASLKSSFLVKDGDAVKKGDRIMQIQGSTASLLKAERVALNFLQRMSGIATLTHAFVQSVREYDVRVVDTRKTTPGLRMFEKYAVTTGGGHNHRYGLSDAVLIKDNHITAAGGIHNAILSARAKIPHTMKIEVETETFEQVQQAVQAKADIIMLDNMDPDLMRKCVEWIRGRAITEASGNISVENAKQLAKSGVDILSVGALTHSYKALDISMKLY